MPHPLLIFSQSDYLIIRLFDPGCSCKFKYWMTTVQIQISWLLQIWIYTVCRGRTYLGSAGQGLNGILQGIQMNTDEHVVSYDTEVDTSEQLIHVHTRESKSSPETKLKENLHGKSLVVTTWVCRNKTHFVLKACVAIWCLLRCRYEHYLCCSQGYYWSFLKFPFLVCK